ncbi:hypothetical protein [Pseudomonas sp. BBP2017]|uniref:hypothetical protein n=1 Tax=Pseudomonas sp. BBP2017 TaxID=2109731 RepID=UPI000D1245B8|nr:hypothetical protein [Pseudomonas sp. BBP2017]PSS59214.1 hypothetical protein C6382_02330 [Pseudomonas sp. BBP2017]
MVTDEPDLKIFSCDDPKDAIRTLSLIHGVEAAEIERVYLGDWPDFLQQDFNSFDSEFFPWLMADNVNGKLNCEFQEAAYYHRARYDGSETWFDNGLLSSGEGAVEFLHKTRSSYEGYDFDQILAICEVNIRERTDLEGGGTLKSGGGPYAFDTFEDAKYGIGENYETPEMFIGPRWGGWCGPTEAATDLIEILSRSLKPVIVKFIGKVEDQERYTTGLWHYLYRVANGLEYMPFTHTFLGRGVTVPYERIISVIDL